MKIFGKVIKICDFIDRFMIRYIGERLVFAIFGLLFTCVIYAGRKILLRFKHDNV